jgi:FkbM family methyltransferase
MRDKIIAGARPFLRASVNPIPLSLRFIIRHIPGIRAVQRSIVEKHLAGEPFAHTVNAGPAAGLCVEVLLPEDKAIWAGIYEADFAAAIACAVNPGDVCLDIGGYRGYISGVMALAGASQVIVFEPSSINHQALRRLCELNPKLPLRIMPFAIGESDTSAILKLMRDPSMAKLSSSPFQEYVSAVDEIEVPVRRIDYLVQKQEIPVPQLIKIDVEGAELEVIQGAESTLRNHHPVVFAEIHTSELGRDCRNLLVRYGYTVRETAGTRQEGEKQHLVCENSI